MSKREEIKKEISKLKDMLETREDLREYLFCRAFLVTDFEPDLSQFPFYGNWTKTPLCRGYYAYSHSLAKVTVYRKGDQAFFLCGHAYDPFTMETEETAILKRLSDAYGTDKYQELIDEITGLYVIGVIGDTIDFEVDPSGMQSAYYGLLDGHVCITSHAQILGDLFDLTINDLTEELLNYKWYYRVMGPYLPADLTQFDEVKRIVPDFAYRYQNGSFTHKRIWPCMDVAPAISPEAYDEVIRAGADILKRNMELVSRKWEKPYISLTGGIDSNTTFASANGIYDRFKTFSYLSAEKETIDVDAAKKISERFGVERKLFIVPEKNEELRDYQEFVQIMEHSSGYIAPKYDSESRKRICLIESLDCDVEVKSWVSETIRAYWYKHYGRKSFPKLSPKLFRNLYKIFLTNRKLAHKIDKVFEKYIREFEYEGQPAAYPPADLHYNEVTWGSWGGLNISDMKIYSDITMIYNNRRFLDLMFRVPLKKRISDQHHLDMKKVLNKELYDMNIRVVNMKETNTRAFLLNCIFILNTILP